jgi:hypothetical protein
MIQEYLSMPLNASPLISRNKSIGLLIAALCLSTAPLTALAKTPAGIHYHAFDTEKQHAFLLGASAQSFDELRRIKKDLDADDVTPDASPYHKDYAHENFDRIQSYLRYFLPLSESLGISVQANYLTLDLDQVDQSNNALNQEVEDWADTQIYFHQNIDTVTPATEFQWTIGFNLPTGNKEHELNGQPLGYDMQLTGGTYDLILAGDFVKEDEGYRWGSHAEIILPLDYNDEGYRLGHEYLMQPWLAKPLSQSFEITTHLTLWYKDNIHGEHEDLSRDFSTETDPKLTGGSRIVYHLGFNLNLGDSFQIKASGGVPLYENLNGPQKSLDLEAELELAARF